MNPCGAPASTVLRPPNYCLREHRGWGRSGLIRTSRPKGLDFSFYSPTACVIEALDASLQADGSSAWAPMRWTPESLSAIPLELRSPNLSALQKIKVMVVKRRRRNSGRGSDDVVRTLRDRVSNLHRRIGLRRSSVACATALDCSGRDRIIGTRDCDRRHGDASERSCGMTP